MKTSLRICTVACLMMATHGCSTPTTHVIANHQVSAQLEFVRDGHTTRSEILKQLGRPASIYEDGRIVIYWLIKNDEGMLKVSNMNVTAISTQSQPWWNIDKYHYAPSREENSGYFNLVLVFTDDGIVERHSIVFIR